MIEFPKLQNTKYKRRRKSWSPTPTSADECTAALLENNELYHSFKGVVKVDDELGLLFYMDESVNILENEVVQMIGMDAMFKLTPVNFKHVCIVFAHFKNRSQ